MSRKIIYSQMVSLDGYIEGKDGDLSWSEPDEELFAFIQDMESDVDTHLYGRHTYEAMAGYWPHLEGNTAASARELAFGRDWVQLEKVVFSRTLTEVQWNTTLVRDEVQKAVKQLKNREGGDMLLGGAGLAASLMPLELIDEYQIYLFPIVLGGGKPFFPPLQHHLGLELIQTRSFAGGVVLLRYRTSREVSSHG
ncbi:dihydrofolate reductase family protein [Paenibacillus daejeonensis]|uniref:dihydrofolate reductase family protein n=1 Tax=Paenibacillus daejeonensis TaxID=135193 RepID=UPI00035DDAD8|nr:dihydrofolate reductase family protein [Paenibacillus daejeonensis]